MAAHRKNNPGNRLSYLLCGTDCLFFCRAAIHCHTEQEHLEASGQILHPETENWDLVLGETGEKPNRKCNQQKN